MQIITHLTAGCLVTSK